MFKLSRILATMILAATPLTAIGAVEPLDVKLRSPDSQQKAESAIVVVSVTNRSNRALLLPKGDSALLTDDGHLLNNVMKVVSADDRPVAYKGRASRVATRDRDERFWTISPGQTMTSEVNLPLNYAIKGGTYSVSYDQTYLELSAWNPDGATYEIAHSNVLSIYANSSLIDGQRALRGKISLLDTEPAGPDQACPDHAQVTTIKNVRSIASSWSCQVSRRHPLG